jgi:hypothetical protein
VRAQRLEVEHLSQELAAKMGVSCRTGIAVQVLLFLAAIAIVALRRPDAILNPQFFAEDGRVWFPDAYNLGLRCLVLPQAGYLHTLTRLTALLALLFPFTTAPLVTNLCAMAVQVLPVNLFLSGRFSAIPIRTRLLGAFLYLALPNSYEVNANITTIQWHLALLACLVLLAEPAESLGWWIFDVVTLVLISVDGPMGILLLPVAAALWWKRPGRSAQGLCFALIPGAILQAAIIMTSKAQRSAAPNGANLTGFMHIVARQIILSSLLGVKRELHIFMRVPFAGEVLITIAGLLAMLYAVWRGPIELKLFIFFVSAVLVAALAHPLAAPAGAQWDTLGTPGAGNRYFFLPTIAFLAALLWIAIDSSVPRKRIIRAAAIVTLLVLPAGIRSDWRYGPFADLHFRGYARSFEQASPGTHMTIPINPPGWSMELSKH